MKNRIIWGTILTFLFFVLVFLCGIHFYSYSMINKIITINHSKYLNSNLLYDVKINYKGNSNSLLCSIDNKEWKDINECYFALKEGSYKIFLKNEHFSIFKKFKVVGQEIKGTFSSSLDNLDKYYLALGGSKEIKFSFDYQMPFDSEIYWNIEDENVVSIDDNAIYGKNVGSTKITATLKDGNQKTYTVVVTDLITPMKLDNNKENLPCGHYTNEENELLDDILESRVKEAGAGTRGGVVAALRFITMEFPYSIKYFYENGRLVDHGYRPHLDGEGRYYHKGLYLSEDKYDELEKGASSKSGPKMWGCDLYSTTTRENDPNGFDCSGFVTWAMFNGGFDVGDVGAGNYKEFNDDLSDLGTRNKITKDYIKNGNYKVGDFIASNGHAALIIGIDEDNIYTAEALPPKVKVYTYDKEVKIINTSNLDYIIEMADIYPNGEGFYTDMWY